MSNERSDDRAQEANRTPDRGRAADDGAVRRQDGEPAKRHGDALLEGNGSRQGEDLSAPASREGS